MKERYQSWGRVAPARQRVRVPASMCDFALVPGERILPFGNGRSYGDSCLSPGTLIDTCRMNRILAFDARSGRVRCEAGVLLSDLIARVLPSGWFVPVTPGTQFVTVGGALANDVHGKNHHARGTFGCHVPAFELWRSDGSRRVCTATQNHDLYRATIGGLGLTGLVTWLDLQLIPVTSRRIDQVITPFADLDAFLALARTADRSHEYGVAWIDSLARGRDLGRGLYIKGNHAVGSGPIAAGNARPRLSVPFDPPLPLVGRTTMKLFNGLFRRQTFGREKASAVDYLPFFYPLDRIAGWNRLYGPHGLYQHQSVLPLDGGPAAVAELLGMSQRAGLGSFLTVLKVFGDVPSPGLMSFPMPGLTLTLDFANSGRAVLDLLERLDQVVIAARGRINPYKDARMSPATFAASFPGHLRLREYIDPAFQSCFWSRVTGTT